jgi:hypothetical protein
MADSINLIADILQNSVRECDSVRHTQRQKKLGAIQLRWYIPRYVKLVYHLKILSDSPDISYGVQKSPLRAPCHYGSDISRDTARA